MKDTNIEWCDHTFNPWFGCTAVSPGCDHCYAESMMDKRLHKVTWGAKQPRVRTSATNWREPMKWNAQHDQFFAEHGRRQRVFCASLADVFDNEVPVQWRIDLFEVIAKTPNLDWMLLTKRIGNAYAMLNEVVGELSHGLTRWNDAPWPNIRFGATIVNREEMLRDGLKLRLLPAASRFWSVEPLLGDLGHIPAGLFPNQIITGGESGPHARPWHINWARSLRDQCAAAGVAYLHKQNGE